MECPHCLGGEPAWQGESGSTKTVTEFLMVFKYVTWKGVRTDKWAHRLIHKKYGFMIDLHDCVDLGDWMFKLSGPWPQAQSAIAKLDAFIKYARRSVETRGRKPKVHHTDIYDALRRLPDTAEWVEIADYVTQTLQDKYGDNFDASVDTLKKILQRRKETLKQARERAKKEDK